MQNITWFFAFILIGCASTGSVTKINGKSIGVAYSVGKELNVCHRHTGLTVFNNFDKRYPIDVKSLVSSVKAGYIKGITSTGNTAIELDVSSELSDTLTYSAWSGTPTANKRGIKLLQQIGKKHQIDYLLIAKGYSKDFDEKKYCIGLHVRTGKETSSPFIPTYIAVLFDTKTGKYVRSTQIRNDEHPFKFELPQYIESITDQEINRYISQAGVVANKGIIELLNAGRTVM